MLLIILTDWGKLSEGLFNFAVAALPVATFLFKQWYESLKKAKANEDRQQLQAEIDELKKQLYGSQPTLQTRRDDVLADSGEKEDLKYTKRTAD